MTPPASSYLQDIIRSCEAVQSFVKDRSFDEYVASLLVRSAVERQVEIVGEATTQLKAHHPDIAAKLGETRGVIAFRNILAHGYFAVDHKIVWKIVADDVPQFLAADRALIGGQGAP